jgi:hypothetical protein
VEAARVHLNPLAPVFDLARAARCLAYAAAFTPQYGDTFAEQLRHALLTVAVLPLARAVAAPYVAAIDAKCARYLADALELPVDPEAADPVAADGAPLASGSAGDATGLPTDPAADASPSIVGSSGRESVGPLLAAFESAGLLMDVNAAMRRAALAWKVRAAVLRGRKGAFSTAAAAALEEEAAVAVACSQVELKGTNAEPNYGHLWFMLKRPQDSAVAVLRRLRTALASELIEVGPLYAAAAARRQIVEHALGAVADAAARFNAQRPTRPPKSATAEGDNGQVGDADDATLGRFGRSPKGALLGRVVRLRGRDWEAAMDAALRICPTLEPSRLGVGELTGGLRPEDFAVGLIGLGPDMVGSLPDAQRRKALFGCDLNLT